MQNWLIGFWIKKRITWCIILLFFSSCCSSLEILHPNDPSYYWMDELIERDFASLPRLSKQDLLTGIKQHKHSFWGLLKHLKVENNQVYGPEGAAHSLLKLLCKFYGLPDLELLYFQMDGLNESPGGPLPIFTGARKKGVKNTILFVDWYFDQKPWGQWESAIDQVDQALKVTPWLKKHNRAVWRGSAEDTPYGGLYTVENWMLHPRGKACWLSTQFPDLLNAAITGTDEIFTEDRHGWFRPGQGNLLKRVLPIAPWMTIGEQVAYKYQLQLLALNAPFSRDWQFYSESVVFRQNIPYETWWWSLLQPGKHYIPISDDLSDLIEKIKWAISHDDECAAMARTTRQLVANHVMPKHILLYCYKAVMRYVSLFD